MKQIKPLDKGRFEAIAGYTRIPSILVLIEEIDWLASEDERVLGVLTRDRLDNDFGWVALAQDEGLRYRAVDVNTSLQSPDEAKRELQARMALLGQVPDQEFYQEDGLEKTLDFFTPIAPIERLSPVFKILMGENRYSPAKELIIAMMPYYKDVDGNFIEQFQTTGFDARVWELYLYATFTELGFARVQNIAAPDFVFIGPRGRIGIEATSVNPPRDTAPRPATTEEAAAYIENYVPARLGRSLRRKLNRRNPYWELPEMENTPFILAIQDFHISRAMQFIVPAATEYVFGVRHSIINGRQKIEKINEHRYGSLVEPSGFFNLPESENISAVIVNPQGTIPKFNRMGYIADFGDRRVRMVRTGLRRGELDLDGPMPKPFKHIVHEPGYAETWVEGMVVLHNPRARLPLDPSLIDGAAHEFLQEDGSILSMLPEFHPFTSSTIITVADDT